MPARKRAFEEVESSMVSSAPPENSLLHKIRNCWQFASLMQYIFFFGVAVKIDQNLDVDELEAECLKAQSDKLSEIGLALLKYVSSHKGLTPEIFDEYTRRQYVAKAPQRNPFGVEEEPLHFVDFDVFTKLSVLHQLSAWTLNNPDRIREKMEEKENEQTQWRIEPLGWDREERSYFVLDDDRLYRKTDPPPPPEEAPKPKPKAKAKPKARKGRRQSKRIKVSHDEDEDEDMDGEGTEVNGDETEVKEEKTVVPEGDEGLGGSTWECLAVSFEEYKAFLETIQKSRDADEKVLYKRITSDVLPIIEKRAEAQERKAAARRRELENLEKMATAKRSSRISARVDKQKELQEAEEAERKRKADLIMAMKEKERQEKMEHARESRMMTREQRLKDREVKRILHEEELTRMRESSANTEASAGRQSERHRAAEMERKEKVLQDLKQQQDEDEFYFDCAPCGKHGPNLDDGTPIMACEKCNVWQHSGCYGLTEEEAGRDDFHFFCASCKKTGLKLKLRPSTSPEDKPKQAPSQTNGHAPPMGNFMPPPTPPQHTNGYHQYHAHHQAQAAAPTHAQAPMAPPVQVQPHQNNHYAAQASHHAQQNNYHAPQNGYHGSNGMPAPQKIHQPPQQQYPPQHQHQAQYPQQQQQPPQQPPQQQYQNQYQPQPPPAFSRPSPAHGSVPPPVKAASPYAQNNFSSPAPRYSPAQLAMTPQASFHALSGNSVAATPATSFHPQFQQTPASASRPSVAAASFQNSPTPSLSASQGAVDFRFQPAPVHPPRQSSTTHANHQLNHHHTHGHNSSVSATSDEHFYSPEGASFVSASAYIPATSAPTVSALSPVKHDPAAQPASPMLPNLPIPTTEGRNSMSISPRPREGKRMSEVGLPDDVPVPDLRSSPEIDERFAGMSPQKHDLPPSSPMVAEADGYAGPVADVKMLEQE